MSVNRIHALDAELVKHVVNTLIDTLSSSQLAEFCLVNGINVESVTAFKRTPGMTPFPTIGGYENLEACSDDVQEILQNQERDARNKALGI